MLKDGTRVIGILIYYIPVNDTTSELSVFWSSDTESWINELMFSDSVSLSFKTRLKSVSRFCGDITQILSMELETENM